MTTERQPKNILVTGGCGFIGGAFIRRLLGDPSFTGHLVNLDALTYASEASPVICVSSQYSFVHANITDGATVERVCREHEIDTIVHFAAETHVDRSILAPGAFIDTNVVGTHRLLEVARVLPRVYFHHVSTDEVYGSLGATGRFTEESPYNPTSPYSASKAASDHLVRAYACTYGLSTTISNCSNNYGPYQLADKLVPLMIKKLLSGKPLPVYGTGSNVRDWLYVDDHVEAIWTILQRGKRGETYNIGGEQELTNLNLVHLLVETVSMVTGRNYSSPKITFVDDRKGHDWRYAVDCSKLKSELGWTQTHIIADGLSKTVRWYLKHPEWLEEVEGPST